MDTNKMREQFESWALREGYNPELGRDGHYHFPHTRALWWAWQASREALVVELPQPEPLDVDCDESLEMEPEEYEVLEAAHGARWSEHSRLKKAIEAQGLKCEVKP